MGFVWVKMPKKTEKPGRSKQKSGEKTQCSKPPLKGWCRKHGGDGNPTCTCCEYLEELLPQIGQTPRTHQAV